MKPLKIGHYEPHVQKKGEDESFIKTKEGDVYWMIRTEDGYIDVKTQTEAEIISRLVRIERLLKNANKNKR